MCFVFPLPFGAPTSSDGMEDLGSSQAGQCQGRECEGHKILKEKKNDPYKPKQNGNSGVGEGGGAGRQAECEGVESNAERKQVHTHLIYSTYVYISQLPSSTFRAHGL